LPIAQGVIIVLQSLVVHRVTRLSFLSGRRSRRCMDTRLQPRGRRPPSSGIQRRLHYEGERDSRCIEYNRFLGPSSPPPQEVLVIPEQERVLFQSHAGVAAGARAPEAEV
jgi:hypothetical protein